MYILYDYDGSQVLPAVQTIFILIYSLNSDWDQLCGDTARSDPRKLQDPKDLFLGSTVFGGRAAPGIQAVFAGSEAQIDPIQRDIRRRT